ncbi:MAG: flagellin [Rhodothermales bacterium]
MRISPHTRQLSLQRAYIDQALGARHNDVAHLQEQLTSGKTYNRASDDAASYALGEKTEVLQARYGQYQRSIESAQLWVNHTQDHLNTVADRLTEVYEKSLQYANATVDPDAREAGAQALEAIYADVVDLMNVKVGPNYLFAGTASRTQPFEDTGAGMAYQGNNGTRTRQIGPGVTLDIGVTGAEVNDTGAGFTVIEAMQGAIDTLRAGGNMDTAIEQLTEARDHIVSKGAEVGSVANRLDTAYNQLSSANLSLEEQRSALQDADYAEVITEFQRAQTGLQAALQVSAQTMRVSLLDYLR